MSKDTKHTPGPWRIAKTSNGTVDIWTTANQHGTICRIPEGEKGMGPYTEERPLGTYGSIVDPGEREANARLIAKSPELLSTLKLAALALHPQNRFDPDHHNARALALQVIAEAEGERVDRRTCEFVPATELVPREWDPWFWAKISDSAPFSWGDNNRTMVCANDFKRHCEDRLLDASDDEGVPQDEIDRFLATLGELGDLYIDLEN